MIEPGEIVVVQEAEWRNFNGILEILRQVDGEFIPTLTETENLYVKVSRIFNDKKRGWIKAVVHGKVVGVVAVIYDYTRPKLGLIETLAVAPEYRKCGIGRRLVQFAMLKLFQSGMESSLITTWETNTAAIHLYTSLGFKLIMERREQSHLKLFFKYDFKNSPLFI
jgi:ribosomal protein S18 acetylase RimI-like enzyme